MRWFGLSSSRADPVRVLQEALAEPAYLSLDPWPTHSMRYWGEAMADWRAVRLLCKVYGTVRLISSVKERPVESQISIGHAVDREAC
jgi:hypothetical protein